MPKLIDADKLKEHYAWWDNEDKKIFDTIVDLQPDAVIHGWWINHISEDGATDGIYCSICDYEIDRDARYKYCPNCGAKMDDETMDNIVINNSNATTVTNDGNAMSTVTRGETMPDSMMFPKTVDEFMEKYKIVDTEEVYTNGAELVPIFRMKQWFEHVDAVPVVRCRDCQYRGSTAECLERDDGWFCADGKRREDAR